MILFYIRHGDPIYFPDSLTPLGKLQAEALARRLSVYGLDRIYSSTSERAYQTAEPTAALTKKDIEKIDFFNEKYSFKYFSVKGSEGKNVWSESLPSFRKMFVSKEVYRLGDKWYEHPWFTECNFGEGVQFFNKNIDEFMLSLGYEHHRESLTYTAIKPNDERIAIFAHGGFSNVFLSSVLDIPYPQFTAHHYLSHTGMTVLEFDSVGEDIIPRILQFGNDSHLYKEGLPTKHVNRTPI